MLTLISYVGLLVVGVVMASAVYFVLIKVELI